MDQDQKNTKKTTTFSDLVTPTRVQVPTATSADEAASKDSSLSDLTNLLSSKRLGSIVREVLLDIVSNYGGLQPNLLTQDQLVRAMFRGFWPEDSNHKPIANADEMVGRLNIRRPTKLAFGATLTELIDQNESSTFIESGSTTALASLGYSKAIDLIENSPRNFIKPVIFTNNLFVITSLYLYCQPQLLLPPRHFLPKYLGFFPESNKSIREAMAGKYAESKKIHPTTDELCQKFSSIDRIIATSSHFDLSKGPFSGSESNAYFKGILYNQNSELNILIDSDKLILSGLDLVQRITTKNCIPALAVPDNIDKTLSKRSPHNLYDDNGEHFGDVYFPATWGDVCRRKIESGYKINLFIACPDPASIQVNQETKRFYKRLYDTARSYPDIRSAKLNRKQDEIFEIVLNQIIGFANNQLKPYGIRIDKPAEDFARKIRVNDRLLRINGKDLKIGLDRQVWLSSLDQHNPDSIIEHDDDEIITIYRLSYELIDCS